jgi:thiamine biosynthesis protein ThiI
MLVLRPLAGYDKEEIIHLASRIGTYEKSIEPYHDCCNFLLPRHPETRADARRILDAEKNIDMKVVEKAAGKAVVIELA